MYEYNPYLQYRGACLFQGSPALLNNVWPRPWGTVTRSTHRKTGVCAQATGSHRSLNSEGVCVPAPHSLRKIWGDPTSKNIRAPMNVHHSWLGMSSILIRSLKSSSFKSQEGSADVGQNLPKFNITKR
jgi:hypothetical protein